MQGILINCYKDKEQLINLIKSLNDFSRVYVNINANSTELNLEELEGLHLKNTFFIKKYKTGWGSYEIINSLIYCIGLMIHDDQIDYIHIISGQDLRVKSKDYFLKKFNKNNNIYMNCYNLTECDSSIQDKYYFKYLFSKYDLKHPVYSKINRIFLFVQKFLKIKKKTIGDFSNIYKGVMWISAPAKVFNYVYNYCSTHPDFLKDLKYCYIAEEIFFQTIIMNSCFKNTVINNNLRYTDWSFRNGSNPAFLDITDIEKIEPTACIFARKADSLISKELIEYYRRKLT